MGGIHPSLDFLECVIILLTALMPDDLLLHHSVYIIIDRYLPHRFTLFAALLHIATFCAFSVEFLRFYCVIIHCHHQTFSFHTFYLHRSLSRTVTSFL